MISLALFSIISLPLPSPPLKFKYFFCLDVLAIASYSANEYSGDVGPYADGIDINIFDTLGAQYQQSRYHINNSKLVIKKISAIIGDMCIVYVEHLWHLFFKFIVCLLPD